MGRYDGNIKVVSTDHMAFPVDPNTLEALGVSCYDPWAWDNQEGLETITVDEWLNRKRGKGF